MTRWMAEAGEAAGEMEVGVGETNYVETSVQDLM